jgi:SagB-type dehydrogenase family enzyme
MPRELWTEVVVSPMRDVDAGGPLFELYHENSKTSRFDRGLPTHEVVQHMHELWESLPYDQYPRVELAAERETPKLSLEEAVLGRHSSAALAPVALTLAQVTTILTYAYGVTRDNATTGFPRPFRTVPSAGALYPLEVYLHTTAVDELAGGLYHYNAAGGFLRHLRTADLSDEIAAALDQSNLAYDASAIFFVTAAFERSTFKYGERGYRFALFEAGHVVQNMLLAATGMGLGSLSIGGFYDREVDALLRLDGVTQSTLYLLAVGAELDDAFAAGWLG